LIYFYVIIGVLSLYSIAVSYYCLKFALIVLRIQDSLEESIDTIDEKHIKMSEILSRPLFYDSPEVRKVVQDIEEVRHSLHQVAYNMTAEIEEEEV